MQRIAQDWLVLELTGSVTAVGVAVALQFLPVLLFGLFGGVIADRYPKRRILMITQSVAATMALTLGLLALTHTVQAWHVFVVAADARASSPPWTTRPGRCSSPSSSAPGTSATPSA